MIFFDKYYSKKSQAVTKNEYISFNAFSASAQNSTLEYRFNWGDDSNDGSWGSDSQDHSWNDINIYCVKAQVRDQSNVESEWSGCKFVTISDYTSVNLPPTSPLLIGPSLQLRSRGRNGTLSF